MELGKGRANANPAATNYDAHSPSRGDGRPAPLPVGFFERNPNIIL